MKNIILDKEEEFLYISSDFSIFQYTTKGKHGKVVAGGDVGQTVSDGVIPRVMQWAAEHVGGADHGHAQLSEQLFETSEERKLIHLYDRMETTLSFFLYHLSFPSSFSEGHIDRQRRNFIHYRLCQ